MGGRDRGSDGRTEDFPADDGCGVGVGAGVVDALRVMNVRIEKT